MEIRCVMFPQLPVRRREKLRGKVCNVGFGGREKGGAFPEEGKIFGEKAQSCGRYDLTAAGNTERNPL